MIFFADSGKLALAWVQAHEKAPKTRADVTSKLRICTTNLKLAATPTIASLLNLATISVNSRRIFLKAISWQRRH
jgi:hypothetical protein